MFDIEKLKNQIDQFKIDSNSIREIIRPYLTDDLSIAKTNELFHLGKFLYKLNENYNIISITESPDFIIEDERIKIGVEIVSIYTKKVEVEKFKKQLVKFSEKKFIEKYPGVNFLANVYFKNIELKLQKHQVFEAAEKIADQIYNIYRNPDLLYVSEILEEVEILKSSQLSFFYNPGSYMVNNLTTELTRSAISKKESKIVSYKQKDLDEIWLLIVVSHSSCDSFEIFEEDEHRFKNFDSTFDKIYILEDFKSKIYCLK